MKLFDSNYFGIAGDQIGVVITSVTNDNKIERLGIDYVSDNTIHSIIDIDQSTICICANSFVQIIDKNGNTVKRLKLVNE